MTLFECHDSSDPVFSGLSSDDCDDVSNNEKWFGKAVDSISGKACSCEDTACNQPKGTNILVILIVIFIRVITSMVC